MGATLLTLATVGLIMPTLYYYVFAAQLPLDEHQQQTVNFLSEEIAFILAGVYIASLIFTFVTHRTVFESTDEYGVPEHEEPQWRCARPWGCWSRRPWAWP